MTVSQTNRQTDRPHANDQQESEADQRTTAALMLTAVWRISH